MSASMHWGGMCWALRREQATKPTRFLPPECTLHGKMDSITQVNTQTTTTDAEESTVESETGAG